MIPPEMKRNPSLLTFVAKLENSSLFLIYRNAFELTTGYRLSLRINGNNTDPEVLTIPVPVGRTFPLQLTAAKVENSLGSNVKSQICPRGLLETFARQLGDESNRSIVESFTPSSGAVMRSIDFIAENISSKLHLDGVAAAAGIGSFQLCRIFKRDTGITMTEYINRKRVQKARTLLSDPYIQIAEIAERAGFTSLSQFSRNFLKFAGESPSEFRQRRRELEHCDLRVANR
ncbi:MAG: helix-turn-helix transcriptional regulator [Akkermansiaceae bacterium]|jgi:transcriptional regulator GlxA family with amidase domain